MMGNKDIEFAFWVKVLLVVIPALIVGAVAWSVNIVGGNVARGQENQKRIESVEKDVAESKEAIKDLQKCAQDTKDALADLDKKMTVKQSNTNLMLKMLLEKEGIHADLQEEGD